MANRMRTAWCHLRASLTHFWSSDVINVIFRKTAITPSFFKIKTSSKKTKLIPDVISNDPNHKIDRKRAKEKSEKRLPKCNHGYKKCCMSISQ